MRRTADRIQLETLPAFADHFFSFVHFQSSNGLRRLRIAPFVEFILRMRVARFEQRAENRLVTFLNKYRGSHSGGCTHATDVIEMVMRHSDVLYRLLGELFLNRTP